MRSGEIKSLEDLLDRLAEAGDAAADEAGGEAEERGRETADGEAEEGNDQSRDDGDDPITLDAMLDAVGRRSFGPLLLLPGLIIVAPVVGDIPTVPTMMALVILLVAVQLLMRRREFWLPGWLTRRSVKRKRIRKAVKGLKKPARWVDRLLRRRLVAFTGDTGSMVIAVTCIVLALAIPPMEFVPFTATVAGAAVSGFGVALVAEDGLVALISFLFTVGALGWALSVVT